jgi:hypothetical protein
MAHYFIIATGSFRDVPEGEDPLDYGIDPQVDLEAPADCRERPYRLSDDGTAIEPDIASARAARWDAVKAKRFAVEDGGCPTPHGSMDSDPESRLKLTGAVTMAVLAAQAGAPFSVDWTMRDNSTVAHDGPAIIAAGMAMGNHVATAHAVATALRGQIEACDSFAALDAIDIEAAPWPSNGGGPGG